MGKPTTDRGGIQQAIRALKADGWSLDRISDMGEYILVSNETQAIEAIEATGMARLYVKRIGFGGKGSEWGWVFFVLGNDPEEVICDYTTNLTCLDTLTDSWYLWI